jgi:hypothetical protein
MTSRDNAVPPFGIGALALVALVALVALAGCGARSSAATVGAAPAAATTASPAVTATRSGTSRSAAGVAVDRRIARNARLRLTDFPSTWTSSPRPAATVGAKCPGISEAKAAVSARAASRAFESGSRATADGAAYIYADIATAMHWFAALSSGKTSTCLVHALRDDVSAQVRSQGARLASITASRATIAPVGDQRAADRFVVRLSAAAASGKADIDLVFVRVGRGVAAFSLTRVAGPFDRTLETKLVSSVVGRLAAGLKTS